MFEKILILLCLSTAILADPLPYAEWAHYHMVWLHNSHSNQIDIETMVSNYTNNNITFGIVNIDSRWATNFNTFVFNSTTFPNVREMLNNFRSRNLKIVLWMTSFVNIDSPNYEFAQQHGYLFNKTIKWWHGEGRLLDYFNPNAVNWWHSQIERLLDTVGPIHAFKADGSDPYILELLDIHITWERYRNAYYNDTFQILRRLIGPDALIMSRPVDNNLEFSPKDIVFMGWVGDEDGTYDGLKTALRYMLESGRRGYVGFGSDIGGYRTDSKAGKLGRTKELFLRWTAIGALSSFMENGGGGEHLPWNFDSQTTDIYRSWVNLHYKFVPYLYSQGTSFALGKNGSLVRECTEFECIASYSYYLGSNLFVVPLFKDPEPGQTHHLWLPKSSTEQWIDYFNTSVTYKQHHLINHDTSSLDRIPLFIEQNSLIPMYDIESDSSLHTYRFVLWGEMILDSQERILFTRDGQQWLLKFDRTNKQLNVILMNQYDSNEREQWFWKFCQYVNEQEICSQDLLELSHQSFVRLENLV